MTTAEAEPGMVPVTLAVPAGRSCQLVYFQDRAEPLDGPAVPDAGFHFLAGLGGAVWGRRLLRRAFGPAGAAKAAAKLATGRRFVYLLTADGRVAAGGWCTVGRCRYYKVGPRGVVVGPIWSDPAARSRGLATFGLRRAMNELIARGLREFFIDTEIGNLPCRRVIDKCGFGPPTALYHR